MTINIQPGHIARHTPRNAGAQGREAAVIDIAQDLLLQRLSQTGSLDNVAIKGGTAIRKLYAGKEGRFSLDLDFSVAGLNADRNLIAKVFAESAEGLVIGPFTYGISERRGKWSITFASRFVGEHTLATKLDFSPAPWMEPVLRSWIPLPIHAQYGEALPAIKTVRLEENIAEKIARLNRTTTARDMYDLAWIMSTPSVAQTLDLALIRRLAVLKIWVDTNGMHSNGMFWNPGHEGSSFDPQRWLRHRDKTEFDPEDIGALAVPTPSPEKLSDSVRIGYSFLAKLDSTEMTLSRSDERDRSLAMRTLQELPGG
ncbi:MAG: nucleotidyl transferase AbiEii/AbiGii toxin family protein, partial [Raoultibacter sp.]